MAKTNITKPTGNVESLNIISAFKVENNIYVVFDSEKMGSMGLPIIYISKYTTKLEKINDANEWQSVKNYLKGIISGTNFEYVKLSDNLTADEAYYTPLTLPQSSFDAIKSRYIVEDTSNQSGGSTVVAPKVPEAAPVMPNTNTVSNTTVNVSPVASPSVEPPQESVMNLIDEAYQGISVSNSQTPTPSVAQTINQVPTPSIYSEQTSSTPVMPNSAQPMEPPKVEPSIPASNQTHNVNEAPSMNFDNDKETFLKACENMFDALISKYQKELSNLEQKEQELARKEAEINERLKNAAAREQVANIAHDNAQKVMDLNNFMPTNPNPNGTN